MVFTKARLQVRIFEAPFDRDHNKEHVWQTMAFNVYEMGTEDAVRNAFDVLSEGGTIIEALGPCDWNPFCANVIDKFGVFWWIAIQLLLTSIARLDTSETEIIL